MYKTPFVKNENCGSHLFVRNAKVARLGWLPFLIRFFFFWGFLRMREKLEGENILDSSLKLLQNMELKIISFNVFNF